MNGELGDEGCEGEMKETEDCNTQPCASWSEWAPYEVCSSSCNGGTTSRIRLCENGDVGQPGCLGNDTEVSDCNTEPCASWMQWSDWSMCSVTCSGGNQSRSRICDNNSTECQGQSEQTQECNLQACSTWLEWSDWSTCSVTCAGGSQSRNRVCENNGTECEGESEQTQECNLQACPTWLEWSDWSTCTVTCAGGSQSRNRVCENNGTDCIEDKIETQECNLEACPLWMNWSDWSTCSVTCSGGSQSRNRVCENESENCEGESEQLQDCNSQNCPRWSGWEVWSDCDVTCGGGIRAHTRQCIDGVVGDVGCIGPITEQENCNEQDCPFWSEWSEFTSCSASCGEGTFTRSRSCNIGNTGDEGCTGDDLETSPCNAGACPQWNEWSTWTSCSETCDGGVRTHDRQCLNGVEGEEGCEGPVIEEEDCNRQACPQWNEWSNWTSCSETCGGGVRTHDRKCLNGDEGEEGCEGPIIEEEDCNRQLCPMWSEWGLWSNCDVTCGGGTYKRNRTCENVPSNSNETCFGEDHMTEDCNTMPCARWSDWGVWSDCDITCGGGIRNHTRQCIDGVVGDVGCEGPITEQENCNEQLCATWAEWNEWSSCSSPCGGGMMNRTRGCLNGEVGQLGCIGLIEETMECNLQTCARFDEWSTWGPCSVSCDGGTQTRSRDCLDGVVGEPGCDDVISDGQNCNFEACPRCDPDYDVIGLSNGDVNCSNANNEESECVFTCNHEHFIVGKSTLVCGNDFGEMLWSSEPPICLERCSDKVDVVFVVDSSSSIGTSNFEFVRGFLTQLVRRFRVGEDAALFGALRYNREIDHLWDLNKYSTKTEVLSAIESIPYDGSGTLIGKAINYTRNNMFEPSVGAREGVPKIAVVVTDGISFDDITVPSMMLKDDNVLVVSIGIGRVDHDQVYEIASGTRSEFATTVTGFDTLGTIVNSVADQIMLCQGRENITECPEEPAMDILYIVDSSSSIGDANFELMRDFILNMIESFMIGVDYTQIGFIKYNRNVYEIFQLGNYSNIDDVMRAIRRVEYSGIGTNTGQALEFAAGNSFRASAGKRPGVPAVTIVITDGKSQTPVYEPSQQLQRYGQVIAVGIQNANLQELTQIASRDEFVFNIDSFVALDSFIDVINLAVCKAGYSPLSLPRNK